VEEAHNICLRLEKNIRAALPDISRIVTHLEPGGFQDNLSPG
jgi:divalent metal cation (Fe/Co/Zn/Cd) transporter